ncbi:MAG TPA: uroporphyrinogen-III synthase [Actinomycetota bacterium]|nr:uroporphyrinogen-III synthase [Actinomycetota bacterium]
MTPDPASEIAEGLAGLVVGIPAARRASETARLVERWGGTPLVGPTVEEVEVGDPEPVLQATRAVIDGPAAWSVHLTGVGTKRWFALADGGGLLEDLKKALAGARVVARGQKASSALRSFGLSPDWVPDGETSGEIAAWMDGKVADGEVVALQRHGEPVPRLTVPLEKAGARIIDVATYHWEIPADREPASRLVSELISGAVHALVITSAPQVRNLFEIAGSLGVEPELRTALDHHVFLASVGSVASGALTERGLSADLEAQPARMGALIRSLAAAREDVLRKSSGAGKAV